jgi:hypothetical protein
MPFHPAISKGSLTPLFSLLLLLFLATGCATPSLYQTYYSSYEDNRSRCIPLRVKHPRMEEIESVGEVKLWRAKGYEVIGTVSICAVWTPRDAAIDMARKNGAEVILFYKHFVKEKEHTYTGVMPIVSNTYHYGWGQSGYSTTVTTIPVTQSYTVDYYDQFAFFLAKRRLTNNFGVYFQHPDNIPGASLDIPAVIDVVLQDSPAAEAGLKPGDKVRSINGIAINTLQRALPYEQGEIKIETMEVAAHE